MNCGCVTAFPRAVMAIINIIFLGLGIALVAVGGAALRDSGLYTDFVPIEGLKACIAAGYILVIVSFIGFYGGLAESKLFLRIYAAFALVVIAIELAAGVITILFTGKLDNYKLARKAGDQFDDRIEQAVNTTWTACCGGFNSGAGYDKYLCKWLSNTNVLTTANCVNYMTLRSALIDYVVARSKPIGIMCFVFIAPQVIALMASCCLLCKRERGSGIEEDDEDLTLPPVNPDEREPDVTWWPFVIVFKAEAESASGEGKKFNLKKVVDRLIRADLRVFLFRSRDQKLIYCKVSASRQRLEAEADRVNHLFRVDPSRLMNADIEMNAERANHPEPETVSIMIEDQQGVTNINPYHFIHASIKYVPPEQSHPNNPLVKRDRLFRRDRVTRMKLRETDVLKLLMSIIRAPVDLPGAPGAGLALERLQMQGAIQEYYCLHNEVERNRLFNEWYKWFTVPWAQPLSGIRSYFGEQIALYFAFMGHSTKWLIPPAFVGLAVWAHQLAAANKSVGELPVYGIFVALWATFYLETWKRDQIRHAMMWGTVGYETTEETRPQFTGSKLVSLVPSYVTGLPMHWFSRFKYRSRITLSATVVGFMICIVLVCVFSIMILRALLISMENSGKLPSGLAGIIAAVINAVQINILNFVYGKVAFKLNDFEHHATDTIYTDNLIAKTFFFQFINSYFNLFYVAFIKNNVTWFDTPQPCMNNEDGVPDCLSDLSSQLGTIFITRLVIGNFTEVVLPWIMDKYKARKQGGAYQNAEGVSQAEREQPLSEYTVFADYSEQIIQFGYVALFVVAFPLAPFLAFVSNVVEIRVDAFKLLRRSSRPVPMGAEDIGTWFYILEAVSIIAVITNIAAVTFSSAYSAFGIVGAAAMVWFFVGVEHAVLGLKWLIGALVPDVPFDVSIQLDRQEYLVQKHFNGVADDALALGEIHIQESESSHRLHIHEQDNETGANVPQTPRA